MGTWLRGIVEYYAAVDAGALALSDIREYLEYPSKTWDGEKGREAIRRAPEICLKDVSYSFEETGKTVVDHVSLTVSPGERVAIVGMNGAGKTTLTKLISGLFTPTGGEIFIDGIAQQRFAKDEYFKIFVFDFSRYSLFTLIHRDKYYNEK